MEQSVGKDIKIISFFLESGAGIEEEKILSRQEAEWEIAKLMSDGWKIEGFGGAPGGEDLGPKGYGMGFAVLSKDILSSANDQLYSVDE